MVEVIIAAAILGVTLSFMVGPVFLLLLEIAMNKGAKRALAFDAGVIFADVLFIIAILYSSSFLKNITNMAWVYGIGGVVIIAYGFYNVRVAKKKKHHLEEEDELPEGKTMSLGLYAVKGFFMNFLNVGVLAYWLATVVVMRASVDNDERLMKIYFIVTVATYALVDVAKIFSARKLQQRLTDAVLIKIERIVGFILIAFGALMITRGILQHLGYSLEEFLGIA
ncbi:LysE family translocator [Phaeocystidibacter luteus]|uniref:LysE family translocator n=1 Tax=Phaeocystidibacter luteus TaxID=911197 RepID=A0A6N6RHM3_9FLAO|nr:LysE family transporter [Phaeocystidibacter luteus]KAB2813878.1 LysE family translocator [Phaeocystidibacter luteus]